MAGTVLRIDPECAVRAGALAIEPPPLSRIIAGRRRLITRLDRCQLVVAGTLIAEGATFAGDRFGGIVLVGRGRARLDAARISGEIAAASYDFATLEASRCRFEGREAGVRCAGFSRSRLRRCESSGAARAGFEALDDAWLEASGCSVSGCATGLAVSGNARALWTRGRTEGGIGASAGGASSLRTSLCDWGPSLVSARENARCLSRADRWSGPRVALETLGRAETTARRAKIARAGTAFWSQDASRLSVIDAEVGGCELGFKASHDSRARADGIRVENAKTAFQAEDRAVIDLLNCYDTAGRAHGEKRAPEAGS